MRHRMRWCAAIGATLLALTVGCSAGVAGTATMMSTTAGASASTQDTGGLVTGTATTSPADLTVSSLITPSKNIRCLVLDSGSALHCVIGQHAFSVDPCTGQPGATVLLDTEGLPRLSGCADESFIGAVLEPVPYDTSVHIGDFDCDVSESGLRCENAAHHGFHLSRSTYEPF